MLTTNFNKLTRIERVAYYRLYKVKGDSPFQIKIHQVVRGGDEKDFRQLLKELGEAAKDNPELMIKIIGEVAFNALKLAFNDHYVVS